LHKKSYDIIGGTAKPMPVLAFSAIILGKGSALAYKVFEI
jgi:hypothetical protein